MQVFRANEVTAAPVYEIDQFIDDPHVQARGIVVEVPDADAGSVLMHNIIPRLSATPGRLRRPAPAIGEHTREVLEAIGCDPSRIADLTSGGVVRDNLTH